MGAKPTKLPDFDRAVVVRGEFIPVYQVGKIALLDAVIYGFTGRSKVPCIPKHVRTAAYYFLEPLLSATEYNPVDTSVRPARVFPVCLSQGDLSELAHILHLNARMTTLATGTRALVAHLLYGIKKRCQQLTGLAEVTAVGTEACGTVPGEISLHIYSTRTNLDMLLL
jgi:hypothetical protein